MQKEIKDAYPKKVCHVLEKHVKKKKKKEKDATCPQSMSKKRKEKRKIVTSMENKEERGVMLRSLSTLHQKFPHTCTL